MKNILLSLGLLVLGVHGECEQSLSGVQGVIQAEVLPMAKKSAKAKKAKVEDIGGVFVYANDPKALAAWYQAKLGIEMAYNAEEGNYYYVFSRGKGFGANSVFAVKPAAAKLKGAKDQFAVNFRVDDFDGVVERLKEEGVALERSQDYPGFGRFGWIKDGEGNQVEFWQPTP